MNDSLNKYQRRLGDLPQRPRPLGIVKSCDLEPVQQADETQRWSAVRRYWPWAVVIAALAIVGLLAAAVMP